MPTTPAATPTTRTARRTSTRPRARRPRKTTAVSSLAPWPSRRLTSVSNGVVSCLGEGVPFSAGQRRVPRKRRKIEGQPRYGRYSYVFSEGDDRRFRLDPSKSPWWDLLNDPSVGDESSAAGRKFRFKFRLPYGMVMALVSEAQSNPAWRDKPPGTDHGRGPARHPLVLKVLAALRHLGKGLDPETLEEGAHISASCLKVFIPSFIEWLGTVVYSREVRLPTGEHLERSMKVYETLGFPGAYCSADGVHVPWDRAPSKNQHLYVGKGYAPSRGLYVCCTLARSFTSRPPPHL